jgi:hypothetical protein
MDYLRLIDSLLESVNINEINGNSRFDILLYIFTSLKTVDFDLNDLDETTTNYLAGKFKSQLINEHLDFLQDYFVLSDIRQASTLILEKKKKAVVAKPTTTPEPVQPQKPVSDGNYDPEADVLDEEGLIEPPPARTMTYDLEFMKTLGITPDE